MIVNPWWVWFSQRTWRELTRQDKNRGPTLQMVPSESFTWCEATNESWLSSASDGRPSLPRNTLPPSPTPRLGDGTTGELQSRRIGGVFGGWIAIPHTRLPPRALHSGVPDSAASAGTAVAEQSANATIDARAIGRIEGMIAATTTSLAAKRYWR